jgi:hypothetical protein
VRWSDNTSKGVDRIGSEMEMDRYREVARKMERGQEKKIKK